MIRHRTRGPVADRPLDPQQTAVHGAARIPRHVAIILDGNRRWARQKGVSVAEGHAAGFAKVPQVIAWADELGIRTITLWMLSVENLRRSAAEVSSLFGIIEAAIRAVDRAGLGRIKHLGAAELLPSPLRRSLADVQDATACRAGPVVNLAIAYSGRHEIIEAIRSVAAQEPAIRSLQDLQVRVTADSLDELIGSLSDPVDLIVRPSGEKRHSGFLLWTGQDAYLCFQGKLWPDYTRADLMAAIQEMDLPTPRYPHASQAPCSADS